MMASMFCPSNTTDRVLLSFCMLFSKEHMCFCSELCGSTLRMLLPLRLRLLLLLNARLNSGSCRLSRNSSDSSSRETAVA